jgi:hypothetical protein
LIKIFIGFDPRETAAFYVMSHSIMRLATEPISITPVALKNLTGLVSRAPNPLQSTEFSFSRFIVPHLCNYEGWAIFMDCDMLVMDDIAKLWALRDDKYAVQVVKHNHQPKEDIKFLGAPQTPYQKKNWTSVMLLNNSKCAALTPDYVNNATGLELHQFKWLESDDLIGEIPHKWNHLVGYDAPSKDVSNAHYTLGGPYFSEYADCEYSKEWFAERDMMLRVDQRS